MYIMLYHHHGNRFSSLIMEGLGVIVSYNDRDDDDMATESVNLSSYILLVASRLCRISSNTRMHIVHYSVTFYVWLLR